MPGKSETFLIGFDLSNGADISCLQVSKVINGKITVTNIYYGEEAENMCNKLENGWWNK